MGGSLSQSCQSRPPKDGVAGCSEQKTSLLLPNLIFYQLFISVASKEAGPSHLDPRLPPFSTGSKSEKLFGHRNTTCQKRAGTLGHELTHAQQFAEWGVDGLKYDNCNPPPEQIQPQPR